MTPICEVVKSLRRYRNVRNEPAGSTEWEAILQRLAKPPIMHDPERQPPWICGAFLRSLRDKSLNDPHLRRALPPNMDAIVAACPEGHPASQRPPAQRPPSPPAGDLWGNWNARRSGGAAPPLAPRQSRALVPIPWGRPDQLPILPNGSPREWPKHSLTQAVRHFRSLGPETEAF